MMRAGDGLTSSAVLTEFTGNREIVPRQLCPREPVSSIFSYLSERGAGGRTIPSKWEGDFFFPNQMPVRNITGRTST